MPRPAPRRRRPPFPRPPARRLPRAARPTGGCRGCSRSRSASPRWSAGWSASATRTPCSSTRRTTRPEAHELLRWGSRVQPRLHVHRPSAAGQVADRRSASRSSATTRWAGGSPRRSPARSPSSSWSGSTRRLTGSTLLGLVAGLLLALDGFSFVISRLGLLDVFLQVFVVAAVACLVVDRDKVRARVRAATDVPATGFRLGPRGWRIAAGFLFGCACAVKWSGIYFLAFFAILSLFWDRAAWREAGVPSPTRTALRRGLPGRALGARRRPGAHLPGSRSPAGSWARRRRAGTGPQQHPDTAVPVDPRRAAVAVAHARRVAALPRHARHAAPVAVGRRGRGWSTAGRSCCGTRRG